MPETTSFMKIKEGILNNKDELLSHLDRGNSISFSAASEVMLFTEMTGITSHAYGTPLLNIGRVLYANALVVINGQAWVRVKGRDTLPMSVFK